MPESVAEMIQKDRQTHRIDCVFVNNAPHDQTSGHASTVPPEPVRWAGVLGIGESLAGIAYAVFLVVYNAFFSHDVGAVFSEQGRGPLLGYGTAVFFFVIFGVVAFAGVNMLRGKRWGRGPVIMLQMLLLPIAYYIFSAGQWLWAIPVGVIALVGLGLSFHPRSLAWAAQTY